MTVLSFFGLLFTGLFAVIFVLSILLKLFGKYFSLFFEHLIQGSYELHKWFTYDMSKDVKEKKQRKREEKMLKKAIDAKKQHEYNLHSAKLVTQAALNGVKYLKNRFPYASQELFDKYLKNFNKMRVDEIKEFETKIEKSHIENKKKPIAKKQYSLSDLAHHFPVQQKSQRPCHFSLYLIDNEYIVHIYNAKDKSDLIIQTTNYHDIKKYFDLDLNDQ